MIDKNNNITLLLLFIVIILFIIYYKTNNKNTESFKNNDEIQINNQLFDELKQINELIKIEKNKTNELDNLFKTILIDKNIKQYLKKNEKGEFIITDKQDNAKDKIIINPQIDTEKLITLQNNLKNNIKNFNSDSEYKKKIKENIINNKLKYIYDNFILLKKDIKKNKLFSNIELNNDSSNVKSIKNPHNNISLNVEKIENNNPNPTNPINPTNPKYLIHVDNKNNTCLSFNKNKPNYQQIEEKLCDKNDISQHMNIDNLKLESKCFDLTSNKFIDSEDLICYDFNKELRFNNNEFIKNYNKYVDLPYELEDNVDFSIVPKNFSVITPESVNLNNLDENNKIIDSKCLNINKDGLSFEKCNLNNNQKWYNMNNKVV